MGVTNIIFDQVFDDLNAEDYTLDQQDYMLTAYFLEDNRMSPEEIIEDENEGDSINMEAENQLEDLEPKSLHDRLKKLKLRSIKRRSEEAKDYMELQKLVHEELRDKNWIEIEREVRKEEN